MNIKYFALALSFSAFLFAGCGSEEKKPADTSLPKAAPIQEIEGHKLISKGKIVGTTQVRTKNGMETITVEEREFEMINAVGKKQIVKKYYDANTGEIIYGYRPDAKDVTLKNQGKSVATFKSH